MYYEKTSFTRKLENRNPSEFQIRQNIYFFLFSTVSKCARVCLEGLADSAVEKH